MDKAADAFRTISEVADDLDVPQHVLRFWETRFPQIRPMKRGGGRRYYRPDDVELLRGIRRLLYGEGYTIRGVQRILKEEGVRFVQSVWKQGAPQPARDDDKDDAGAPAMDPPAPGMSAEQADATQEADTEPPARRRAGSGPDAQETVQATRLQEPSGNASAPAAGPAAGRLSEEDAGKLQAALSDIGECKRILDAVLKNAD